MKHVLFIIVFFLLVVPKAFAETSVDIENNGEGVSSDVHVENNVGQSTVCTNGKCETTQNGDNKTTVCINGKCETTQGNVDRQEGGASVHVQNGNSAGQTPRPNTDQPLVETITPTPTHEASHSGQKKDVTKPQDSGIQQIIDSLRKFFADFFSSNK